MTGFFTRDSYSFNWIYVRHYTHYALLYATVQKLSLVDSVYSSIKRSQIMSQNVKECHGLTHSLE